MNKILYIFLSILIALNLASCDDDSTTAPQPEDNVKAEYSDIQEKVFSRSCALSGCHGGSSTMPNLSAGQSYDNIVNVESNLKPGMDYIEPGEPENSWLYKMITGQGTQLMPQGGPKMDQAILDSIRVWIENGAERN